MRVSWTLQTVPYKFHIPLQNVHLAIQFKTVLQILQCMDFLLTVFEDFFPSIFKFLLLDFYATHHSR